MKTFRVKNFETFQHYKDRSPPWIKLYNELLDDYEFGRLQDASKMHLIAIWLLASRSDNVLPYDAEWIARRINASEPVNLEALLTAGFIIENAPEHVASKTLAKRLSRDRDRGERETEARKGASVDKSKVRKNGTGFYVPKGSPEWDAWKKYAFKISDVKLQGRLQYATDEIHVPSRWPPR